ncbi:aldo/keto reductase [Primorskyibacter sp. 2E107]|uniref:aldo/keto reductase n=1 Tax=Primorskyibacter sp. 2E107 TaxID=3403458 RepID=UPI003AF5B822
MSLFSTISGKTPLPFCFGAMQFGGKANAVESRTMYDACRAAGIAFFDTAHVYTDGESERLLGRFAAQERDDLLIATKASYSGGASRAAILDSVDQSRSRMSIDVIDLLYMHRWDPDTPLPETFGTLAELQQKGIIRRIGVSNYAAWQVMKAQAVAAEYDTRIDAIQPMYNLVKRQAEVELLPMCAGEGIVPVPYSPLGGGLLTGKYAGGGAGRLTENAMYQKRYAQESMHQTAKDLAALARDHGTSPATLAVAWVARHVARPVPILSASKPDQLSPSLAAIRFEMDDALYDQISALSPTPPPATDRLEEA